MTFISIEKILRRNSKTRYTDKIMLKCDFCGKIFECKYYRKKKAQTQKNHFCSKKCASQSLSTKGALFQAQSQGQIEKYGGYFTDTQAFKDSQVQFCLEKYGVKSRLEAPVILEKIKETCVEKYGRETFAGSDVWENKIDRKEIARKAWLTKIENGSCTKSIPEERLNIILIEQFGQENVLRQIEMIGQWIDFYVKLLNMYIQVDGVYWHGLNRDIEIIKQGKTRQDKDIYQQMLRDTHLNIYVKENDIKLFRITDEQMKKMTDQEIIDLIMENK